MIKAILEGAALPQILPTEAEIRAADLEKEDAERKRAVRTMQQVFHLRKRTRTRTPIQSGLRRLTSPRPAITQTTWILLSLNFGW